MSRAASRRSERPAAAPEETPTTSPPRLTLGWRVALGLWALAFTVMILLEIGAFLWRALARMFGLS